MNKKAIRFSFNKVLSAAGKLKCEDLHHNKNQFHESDYICPAKYELDKHINNVKNYFDEAIKR